MRTVRLGLLASLANYNYILDECNALLARYTQCIPQRCRVQNYARNRKIRNYSMALPRKDYTYQSVGRRSM